MIEYEEKRVWAFEHIGMGLAEKRQYKAIVIDGFNVINAPSMSQGVIDSGPFGDPNRWCIGVPNGLVFGNFKTREKAITCTEAIAEICTPDHMAKILGTIPLVRTPEEKALLERIHDIMKKYA